MDGEQRAKFVTAAVKVVAAGEVALEWTQLVEFLHFCLGKIDRQTEFGQIAAGTGCFGLEICSE